jgi:hypothetical protein
VIQDQLSNLATRTPIIISAIEKEPAFVEHILHTASQSNRQNQTVNNVKHGLGVLGFDRTSHVLLEYALVTRLNQQVFPLQQQLLSFSTLLANIAGAIIHATEEGIADQARTLAYFLMSRLFTHPKVRVLKNWQPAPNCYFDLDGVMPALESTTLGQGALVLATHWQQSNRTLDVIKRFSSKEQTRHSNKAYRMDLIMGLSLVIAKHIYFSNLSACHLTQDYVKSALLALSLTQNNLDEIKKTIGCSAYCYADI